MDFSPPSEDSESLGKLQSIYILHKIAVKKSDNAVLRVCMEINIYIYVMTDNIMSDSHPGEI